MATDPETLRLQAHEWGRLLLVRAPWEPLSERLSLILVAPKAAQPELEEDAPPVMYALEQAPPRITMWLLIDRASAQGLPESIRHSVLTDGIAIERHAATVDTPAVDVLVRTVEAIEQRLQGMRRGDLELRWTLQHAEPVADRMHRLDQLGAQSRLLPPDGLERAIRTLWLEANSAVQSLWTLETVPAHALVPAGEVAGSLLRLACLIDHGAHPTAELLRSEAAQTRIGLRLGAWLDDVGAGVGGDDAAGRRATNAGEQVLEEVRQVLRERYADRAWLRDPAVYELRTRR